MKTKTRVLAVLMTFVMAMSLVLSTGQDSVAAKKTHLNKKNLSLNVGESAKLKLVNASGKVTWKSGNKKVATVSNKGVVKAVKEGKATIIAKNKKKSYTCKVVVKDDHKVLNIYCWNEQIKDIMEMNYPKYKNGKIGDIRVNFVVVDNENGKYDKTVTKMLKNQSKLPAKDRIDIFLAEPSDICGFVSADTDYALPVSKLGITDSDTSEMYEFTKQIASDEKGVLRGLTYQAYPGGMIYRRSLAKEYFGTDDPEIIQEKVSDWTKFYEACETIKTKSEGNTYMLSTPDELEKLFRDKYGVIGEDNPAYNGVKDTMLDAGYVQNPDARMWSTPWNEGMSLKGGVFAYFGVSWFINYVMPGNSGAQFDDEGNLIFHDPELDTYGDWAFCKGPQPFNDGGTWYLAARNTDNKEVVADLLKTLCCDQNSLYNVAVNWEEFVNGKQAVSRYIKDNHTSEFLGGQNPFAIYDDIASSLTFD